VGGKGVEAAAPHAAGAASAARAQAAANARRAAQGAGPGAGGTGRRVWPPGRSSPDLKDVSIRFGTMPLIDGFSATIILRGDKGRPHRPPTVCGKTTLLKLILGELQPDRGQRSPGARGCRSPTSTRCAPRWTSTPRWPTPSARAATWIELGPESRRTRKHRDETIWATSCSPPSVPSPRAHAVGRRAQPAAAGATVRAAGPMCWCSTSRPTTSTSTRSNCSRTCCRPTKARSSWSATTGASSTTSSPARSPGKATRPGAARPGLCARIRRRYEDVEAAAD